MLFGPFGSVSAGPAHVDTPTRRTIGFDGEVTLGLAVAPILAGVVHGTVATAPALRRYAGWGGGVRIMTPVPIGVPYFEAGLMSLQLPGDRFYGEGVWRLSLGAEWPRRDGRYSFAELSVLHSLGVFESYSLGADPFGPPVRNRGTTMITLTYGLTFRSYHGPARRAAPGPP